MNESICKRGMWQIRRGLMQRIKTLLGLHFSNIHLHPKSAESKFNDPRRRPTAIINQKNYWTQNLSKPTKLNLGWKLNVNITYDQNCLFMELKQTFVNNLKTVELFETIKLLEDIGAWFQFLNRLSIKNPLLYGSTLVLL
jgi:hypothetical protein